MPALLSGNHRGLPLQEAWQNAPPNDFALALGVHDRSCDSVEGVGPIPAVPARKSGRDG